MYKIVQIRSRNIFKPNISHETKKIKRRGEILDHICLSITVEIK
jgi:hypothetical protein